MHGTTGNKSRFNLSWGVDTNIAGRARTIGREESTGGRCLLIVRCTGRESVRTGMRNNICFSFHRESNTCAFFKSMILLQVKFEFQRRGYIYLILYLAKLKTNFISPVGGREIERKGEGEREREGEGESGRGGEREREGRKEGINMSSKIYIL